MLKTEKCPDLFIKEMVREVLDELDLIPEDYNIYNKFMNFIGCISPSILI